MKLKSLKGIQKRILNKKDKNPFAISPGFESKRFFKCQFIIQECPYIHCNEQSIENTSYCEKHFTMCYIKKIKNKNIENVKFEYQKDGNEEEINAKLDFMNHLKYQR